MTNRRAQPTRRDPVVYRVGTDISQAQYDDLVVRVSDWFAQWRKTDEPSADARMRIKCCLEGKTLDGQPWYSHWGSTFAVRMRMMCRYDVDKLAPITTGDEKRKARKDAVKAKETATRREKLGANDPNIPELTRKELPGHVKYGDKALPVTEAELRTWNEYRDAYLEQFPELRTVNAKGELSMLCDLQVVHERNRLKLLSGQSVSAAELLDTTKLITELKKALAIHPDQLIKRVKDEHVGSVADAAARFEAMPKELRDKFHAEELLLLFQAYMTPSPRGDGDGYQLDEIGLFGATRCRTCYCPKCNSRNYAGIAIDEITSYLIEKGVLEALESPVDVLLAKEEHAVEGSVGV